MLSRNAQVIGWMQEQGMIINDKHWSAPLAVHLWMHVYMASWHRNFEAFRKWKEIKKCPKLVQGIKRREPQTDNYSNDQ